MGADEITLIVNPGANRGRSAPRISAAEGILRGHGVSYRIHRTESYGEIEREARRAREEGSRVVVACGGDGTNRAVATALAHTDTPMGVLPCGRGNDLARALGIPFDPQAAMETILGDRWKIIDLGSARGAYFTTVAALGIDSEVSQRVQRRSRAPSSLTYPLTLVTTLVRFRFPRVVLEGDFGRRDQRILVAATANTPLYGGGMKVAPLADPTDGQFDVCVIRALSRLKLLAVFPTVYRGQHLRFSEVEIVRTRKLRIESDRPLSLYGDGELIGRTPITLEVRPRVLRVCVP